MSKVLQFTSNTIPLGATIADMQATIKGLFTSNGWQVHYEVVPGTVGTLDLIPPASETIGDGSTKDIVRLTFSATSIQIQNYMYRYANPLGQTRIVVSSTVGAPYGAGAIAHSLTIDGVTVSGAVGSASSTANENHYSLFQALRDSANATITDWDFYYFKADRNNLIPEDAIWCVRKTVSSTMKSMSATNCTLTAMAYGTPYIPVQTPGQTPPIGFNNGAADPSAMAITVDLTNGWIYYFACLERSFFLCSQTVAGKYGPLAATWIENDVALAAKPTSKFASIMESFIGVFDSSVGGQTSLLKLKPAKFYMFSHANMDNANTPTSVNFASGGVALHPFLYQVFAYESSDSIPAGYAGSYHVLGAPLGFSNSAVIGLSTETISPMALVDGTLVSFSAANSEPGTLNGVSIGKSWGTIYGIPYTPTYELTDIYRALSTIPDGVVQLAELATGGTTTTTNLDATTDYTSIALADASAFPATGGNFFINGEPWHYTGKTGNTLTGTTRALYGRAKRKSFTGDQVKPGFWFFKYNYAAIPVGYESPI